MSVTDFRIQSVLDTIDTLFESPNEFIAGLFESEHPSIEARARSLLRYQPSPQWLPARLLRAIDNRCASKRNLRHVITEKAAEYAIQELVTAAQNPKVHLEDNDARLADVDGEFGLGEFVPLYQGLLPCLFLYFNLLLTALNISEIRKKVEKQGRSDQADRVRPTYTTALSQADVHLGYCSHHQHDSAVA
jgi:hypothetical protein